MKKLFLILFSFLGLSAYAVSTTDYVHVIFDEMGSDPIELNGTSDLCYFTVRLEGTQSYTGYSMKIHIPAGVTVQDVVMANDGYSSDGVNLYPFTTDRRGNKTFTHTLNFNQLDNSVIVACLSLSSEDLTAMSGDLFYVFMSASAYMKPGDMEVVIDEVHLTHNDVDGDGVKHAIDNQPSVACGGTISGISGDCTLPLAITAENHWSTCILPFATALPEGLQAYTCENVADGITYLTAVNSMEAYTPYILYTENGFSGNLSGTVDPALYPESGVVEQGLLHGAIVAQSVNEGYILTRHEDVAFYLMDTNATYTIPEGKCWLTVPAGALVEQRLVFAINPIATAVENIRSERVDAPCVDILGRAVAKPQQGSIYIRAGKKFIQK